jgi:tripartite-type tricarboxylate transporter receptor subunit TctC
MRSCLWALTALACAMAPLAAHSQAYPSKPIRMILTYGGGAEAATRLVGQKIGDVFGQPVVIESQSGAAGSIGATTVARAAPDGYTLLSSTGSTQMMRMFLVKNMPYDPIRDFTPITLAWDTMTVWVANSSIPGDSMKDLIDYAKRNPGKISFGTSGTGSTHHFSLESVKLLTGVDILHVPYKSGTQPLIDLIAGRIQVSSSIVATVAPYLNSGKVKALAVVNDRRFHRIPNVPSMREVIPGFESPPFWSAFYGPAGLPPAITRRLHDEIVKALDAPDVKSKLDELGLLVVASTSQELADATKAGIEKAARIAKAARIEPEE